MTTLIEAPTRSGSRVIAALAGAVLVYSLMQTMLVRRCRCWVSISTRLWR